MRTVFIGVCVYMCVCVCSQKADWYLRRHKQEQQLLLAGSEVMGVTYTEGVSPKMQLTPSVRNPGLYFGAVTHC